MRIVWFACKQKTFRRRWVDAREYRGDTVAMRQTPIHLDTVDRELLTAEAQRLGTTLSAIVRRLIREHLPTTPQQVRR